MKKLLWYYGIIKLARGATISGRSWEEIRPGHDPSERQGLLSSSTFEILSAGANATLTFTFIAYDLVLVALN